MEEINAGDLLTLGLGAVGVNEPLVMGTVMGKGDVPPAGVEGPPVGVAVPSKSIPSIAVAVEAETAAALRLLCIRGDGVLF